MNKPARHSSHILSTTSRKFFEGKLPDEWLYNIPDHDYGIDYNIEIAQNGEVTGLNFSVQLKSTAKSTDPVVSKVSLKSGTLGYFVTRLEPVMLIQYEHDTKEAFWSWINDFSFDLSNPKQKTFTLAVSKLNKLSELNWDNIVSYVQEEFNRKSFISGFDVSKISEALEREAWKTYYRGDFEQAVYLFRKIIREIDTDDNTKQAYAWCLYQTYNYNEALNVINNLLDGTDGCSNKPKLQTKACILAEFGLAQGDKGKIIQAKNLFEKSLEEESTGLMFFNYANTLNSLNYYEEAVENYKISLSKNINYAPCWKNLGSTYYNLKNHEEEMTCYNTALTINPNLAEALFSKGITLADIYEKYEEALSLFNKVLSLENNLSEAFVNGYYWIAFCHAELGDLKSALSMLDRGLNTQGTNPYLLSLKSRLLIENWQVSPEIKKQAKAFFEYLIELNNDFTAIYYFLKIEGYDLDKTLAYIKERMPLYFSIIKQDLLAIDFNLEKVLTSILHLDVYQKLRETYPPNRYVNHLIIANLPISMDFWAMMDVVRAYAVGEGMIAYDKSNSVDALFKTLTNAIALYLPKLVDIILAGLVFEDREKNEIFVHLYTNFETIFHREVGMFIGHFTGTMRLSKVDPADFLEEQLCEQFCNSVYDALRKKLEIK